MPDTQTLDLRVSEPIRSSASPTLIAGPDRKPRGNAKKKIIIAVAVLVVLAGLVALSVRSSQSNVLTVNTSKILREDISSVVTGSGEIKAKTYVNIGAQGFGKIVQLRDSMLVLDLF